MQDSNETSWASDLDHDSATDSLASGHAASADNIGVTGSDDWQQYRRWISKAPVPRGHRTGVDPSVYTWKGYRRWTEQVKRNWSDS